MKKVVFTLVLFLATISCNREKLDHLIPPSGGIVNSSLQFSEGNKNYLSDEVLEVIIQLFDVDNYFVSVQVDSSNELFDALTQNTEYFYDCDPDFNNVAMVTYSQSDIRMLAVPDKYKNRYIVFKTSYSYDSYTVTHSFLLDYEADDYGHGELTILEPGTLTVTNHIYTGNPGSDPVGRPCGHHPGGESFKDCYKREWDEFCDSFVSCIFRDMNAPIVAIVIAAHCCYCGSGC